MENSEKIVDFHRYCQFCIHFEKGENEAPCDDCLAHPTNTYSEQPVRYDANERLTSGKRQRRPRPDFERYF